MYKYTVKLNGSGNSVTKSYAVIGSTYALARSSADAIKLALAAVTDAVIAQETLSEITINSTAFAPAGTQVENQASLALKTNLSHNAVAFVPGAKPSLFLALTGDLSNVIDVTNADIVAYVEALKVNSTVSDGELVATLTGGKRIHKTNRRG